MLSPTEIAIAIVEHEGKYLIGPRPQGSPLAGLWEFPGGKVEPGEAAAEAAQRECREETGLEVNVVDEFPSVVHTYDHDTVRLRFFRCRLKSITQPSQPRFRWVEGRRLREFEFPDANAIIIERLMSQMAGT